MLAHTIHFRNWRATFEQGPVNRPLFLNRDAVSRKAEQCRSTAGNKGHHQIIPVKSRHHVEHPPCCLGSRIIGNRMGRFNNFDVLAWHRMAITGHDQALNRTAPGLFESLRHGSGCLSRPHHNHPALGLFRQVLRHAKIRHGGPYGSIKHRTQKGAGGFRRHGYSSSSPGLRQSRSTACTRSPPSQHSPVNR